MRCLTGCTKVSYKFKTDHPGLSRMGEWKDSGEWEKEEML